MGQPARRKNRNNSHELRDFIVLPSSVWASHRNELRQEQAACKQAALARAPGDDTKSVLGIRFRTTRRSRGGAARGGGTPSSTSKAPGSSARWRTFLCTITTQTRSGSAPVLSTATRVQRHAARMTHSTITSTPQTLQAAAAACRSSMTERYARSCLLLDPWRSPPMLPQHAMRQPDAALPRPLGTPQSRPHAAIKRSPPDCDRCSALARDALEARTLRIHAHVFVMEIE